MDEMVQVVQKWVNQTYGYHPQFQKITENEKTGWSTVYALTRALQIELGITTLADSFGPTTLTELTKKYPVIGPVQGNSNNNIVKIIQGGLYCKGYPGGSNLSGEYTASTANGILEMQTDMGLNSDMGPGSTATGLVTPKVFKALLTMDAYVVIGNGTEKIRSIQQYLNRKYINRANFFFMPCDGLFSRDVQKALVYAIQYELGMSDSVANGNFGPGTQSGLKGVQLKQGPWSTDTYQFVYLFQAALNFNNYEVPFDGEFSQEVKGKVEAFQTFAKLPVTGESDFQTWASLLVSTGDPTRKGKACDTVTEITSQRAAILKAAGYETVGRYLTNVPGSSLNKKIQVGELQTIFDAGLTVFPIFQTYGGEASYFNEQQGELDAQAAYKAAKGYGFNRGTVIYFAVDFDATEPVIESNIIPHFQGIQRTLSQLGDYRVGIYGSRNVSIKVSDRGLAVRSFVSGMSTGFSGNLGFPLPSNWAFDQISTISVGSGSSMFYIDNNIKSGRDLGADNVSQQENTLNKAFIENLEKVSNIATIYTGLLEGKPSAEELVSHYYRSITYNGLEWDVVAGEIEYDFIEWVNNEGVQRERNIVDPETLMDLSTDHLFAAINGIIVEGRELPEPDSVTIGDGAGWMGDLVTTMVDYRDHNSEYSSAYELAMDYIAATKVSGYFNLNDYIEDIDGWNIAYQIKTSNKSIVEIFRDYYTIGYKTRYSTFLNTRHGGSFDNAESAAKAVFDQGGTLPSGAFVVALLATHGILGYTLETANGISDAYVDILREKVENEG